MTVYLFIDPQGQVKRAYLKRERAEEDLQIAPDGKVQEIEVTGGRVREPKPRAKKEKVTVG